MAIKQLTDEQVNTMSVAEKDRWWLANVFKGDMPQLTIRSALTGMLLGGVLSLTNLYIGSKTGWTLGVGITSVILAFAMFRLMQQLGFSEFTILENNCMQSIATAAGYMTAPMISSLAAYMMVTGTIIPMHHTMIWIIVLALLGVLFAFPLKRRFINDEQHAFPEGRAAGIVMDALHSSDASEGFFKARLLAICGGIAALIELLKQPDLLGKVGLKMIAIPGALEEKVLELLQLDPKIGGTPLNQLTVSIEPDHVMVAAGGLMGIRTATSLLVGACLNYLILAPWMIASGDILPKEGTTTFGFRQITQWSLWPGVAMMTTASLVAFFAKPKVILTAFSGLFGRRKDSDDCLRNIELPMSVFVVGIPIVGALTVYLAWLFFDVSPFMGAIAVPLVFVFTLIGANSTALTGITPTGALGKLTQLTYGMLAPGNIKTNLMTAGITGEVASNASNLLMDIKPGYMLGGKPRHQAIGHALGIFAGALASVPVFYFAFLKNDINNLASDAYPMPAAQIWKAVAEVLTQGIGNLPETAAWAALVGAVLGIVMEIGRMASKQNKFPLSPVGIGLAFVISWSTCFAMFLGAFLFWACGKKWKSEASRMNKVFVQNQEAICAGVIAGGALMGIAIALAAAMGK